MKINLIFGKEKNVYVYVFVNIKNVVLLFLKLILILFYRCDMGDNLSGCGWIIWYYIKNV